MSSHSSPISSDRAGGAALEIPGWKEGTLGRLVTIFGSLGPTQGRQVHYIFDTRQPRYSEFVHVVDGPLHSICRRVPAAAWYERELHDQYGIEIVDHPDLRPLVFHDNWPEGLYPMVHAPADIPWSKREYRFLDVKGEGVAEVAVGPVHAGIIEPGHFRFSVIGDTILHLELRHFYTHKGIEKLFEGKHPADGCLLAESVSGDNCFAHAVCYAQAVEAACNIELPPRSAALRLIGLELERLVCHISDIGGLCMDVGFIAGAAGATRLKEELLQASARCTGTRYWRGIAIPGGLRRDLSSEAVSALAKAAASVHREFSELVQLIVETPSIQNRFEGAGALAKKAARDLAIVGPVARASGIDLDVRRDHPYGFYRDTPIEVPVRHYGDVMARARIRTAEAMVSAALIQSAAASLPEGRVLAALPHLLEGHGFSAVESPRGELAYWFEMREGRVARCHIKSPSFQNWPAMPFAVAGNVIADFPLVNKSFNLSYSGCDR